MKIEFLKLLYFFHYKSVQSFKILIYCIQEETHYYSITTLTGITLIYNMANIHLDYIHKIHAFICLHHFKLSASLLITDTILRKKAILGDQGLSIHFLTNLCIFRTTTSFLYFTGCYINVHI